MNYKRFFISLALPQLAGLIGALFTTKAISTWYMTLEKPFFSPPNWLFGPVWFLLYLMMGISIYLIWQKKGRGKGEGKGIADSAFSLFWHHLAFNASWSLVFFGLKNLGLAFINILILWAMILLLILKFWKIDRRSGLLLSPYLAWVSFATVLNYSIWMLN